MRFLQAAVLFCFLLAPVAANATTISDPVKFVRGMYGAMAAETATPFHPPEDIYTPRLAALFALERKESGGEVGRIDFNFWSNSQDWVLKAVRITGVPVEGAKDRVVVIAKFRNTGAPQEIHYYFEKQKGRWLLDDARSVQGETWTLSLILKYGWDGQN